ncbi:MAG: purine-nucleoside phosphorylase [Coriobacteriia bacterium]|nr:purine-nucleoside phosphorylase [Coriobacteriia bacterium]
MSSAADELEPVEVAIILGSGFSRIAERIGSPAVIPFEDIEDFPSLRRSVLGHAGRLVVGTLGGRRVAAFQGRLHGYQGYSAFEVAAPVRVAASLGAKVLLVTNAAGAVSADIAPGEIVLLSDQLNLTCGNPLVDQEALSLTPQFVSMREAFDPELRTIALQSAVDADVAMRSEGVYAGLLGPSYETAAEVRMLRTLGADVVGMSTVHEVIAARAHGLRVLGLSLVTNAAAGEGLSHADVLEMGRANAVRAETLVLAILQRLSGTL